MRERGGRALLTVTLEALCGGTGAEEAEGPGWKEKNSTGEGVCGGVLLRGTCGCVLVWGEGSCLVTQARKWEQKAPGWNKQPSLSP